MFSKWFPKYAKTFLNPEEMPYWTLLNNDYHECHETETMADKLKRTEYSYFDSDVIKHKNNWYEIIYGFYWEGEKRKTDVFLYVDYYFYAEQSLIDNISDEIIVEDEKRTSINNKTVQKVKFKNLRNFYDFRHLAVSYRNAFESDLKPLTRWLGKYKPKFTKNFRKIYLDIECRRDETGNYSLAMNADAEICLISLYDSFTEIYHVLTLDKYVKNQKLTYRKEPVTSGMKIREYYFANETDMLIAFTGLMHDLHPDYILGWNINEYDLPFIINRLTKLNLDYSMLSPKGKLNIWKSSNTTNNFFSSTHINILGIGIVDLLKIAKIMKAGRYVGYSLDNMSKEYLNSKKVEIDDVDKLVESNMSELIYYNLIDVKLTIDLDEKLGFFNGLQTYQNIVSTNIDEAMIPGKLITQYFLQKSDAVLLTVDKETKRDKFEGPTVLDSRYGVYENCYKFDFLSMYPSIIMTYNISPDTILPKKTDNCISMEDKFFFDKSKTGFVSKGIKLLYEKRVKYKKAGNKEMQTAYKLIINSIYGQMSAPFSRIYSLNCSRAITNQARRVLSQLVNLIESEGKGKVILGDTDSIVFSPDSGKDFDAEEILKISKIMLNKIYKSDNIIENQMMELEYEKFIEKMIVFGSKDKVIKKKYVEYAENKLKFAGIEVFKVDTIKMAKDLQMELIWYFIKNKFHKRSEIKEIIAKYRNLLDENIANKKWLEIAIPSKISKTIETYKVNNMAKKAIINSKINIELNEKFYVLLTLSHNELAFKTVGDLGDKTMLIDKTNIWRRIQTKGQIFLDLLKPEQKELNQWLIK